MTTRNNDIFTTIRTEGALLPPDLLRRISDGDTGLDGLRPADYHLSGERLNEAINRAWNSVQGAWSAFKAARESLAPGDLGTTITRERWLLPLFRELDYGRLPTAVAGVIDGRTYPVSHRWENVPIHLVSYQVELDRRTPGVAGAATTSPHSLLQVFLNRSDENLWGFVSNGLRLRILRDNVSLVRQSYVEFDLEAMMEGEVYADFVLLWLLCHQSRVEGARPSDCWLEKWMKTAEDQGTRALEQLRVGVERAINALGAGFIAYPANRRLREQLQSGALDKQDYYRQLLRVVYRLLILFVAEDRALLYDPKSSEAARALYAESYSTQRLRRIAERLRGTQHADLYESLRLVMRLLSGQENGKAAALGLPVLGSFLFSDEAVADIIDCQIANANLLDAVRAIGFVEDKGVRKLRQIDYKNLGPEELGSVYESLLELHPDISIGARTFALTTAGGNERKTTGSYYTPTSLINALLESALDPVIAEARSQPDRQQALLALTVCDPACGSGHFLIAAAHRIARALASERTGDEEPSPDATREALRDVIGHCIYGVDINPMAVELCKVNLWMEALEPGKPLSFLEHRIKQGNSLLGTTPALMAQGIPDDVFIPIVGDDKQVTTTFKRLNRDERKQRAAKTMQLPLMDFGPVNEYRSLTKAMQAFGKLRDDDAVAARHREDEYQKLASDPTYIKIRLLADAWCAAFVWERRRSSDNIPLPMTDLLYRRLEESPDSEHFRPIREYVYTLKERYKFFHWHVAFPDVFDLENTQNAATGWSGGFDCVLGNPPWERIKIQEKEWFAERRPDIAATPNAAARKRMIDALAEDDPTLFADFRSALRQAEAESQYVRISGRYPLCGRGDVNTYTIFAETARYILNPTGRVGMIVPSGIATDDTTKFFFQDLMDTDSLVSLYDFENRDAIFPGVHRSYKFCLLTMAGADRPAKRGAEFVFFALNVGDLNDNEKRFTLSAEDIALLNPNTRTCATFRSRRDAELTKAIYKSHPVLLTEAASGQNNHSLRVTRMFDMNKQGALFEEYEATKNKRHLDAQGRFVDMETTYLPLIEGKTFSLYDHRAAVPVEGAGGIRTGGAIDVTHSEHRDPRFIVKRRLYIDSERVDEWAYGRLTRTGKWIVGFMDVTASTNHRTMVAALLPDAATDYSVRIVVFDEPCVTYAASILATFNSFIFDYIARQKLSGLHFSDYITYQMPVPNKSSLLRRSDFLVPRVLELSYTAYDLQPFAQDIGYNGPPFVWDDERRFVMRCELDALYFHLYGIARDDVDYIMDTFPIVRRKDEAGHRNYSDTTNSYSEMAVSNPLDESDSITEAMPLIEHNDPSIYGGHYIVIDTYDEMKKINVNAALDDAGDYRTKRTILEIYDEMAALGVHEDPDAIAQYVSRLDPPPGDARAAHKVE